MIIFGVFFSRLGTFPQVFGQVKEWLILELQEMIKVPHEIACAIDFDLICNRGQQGKVLKPTKNDHFQLFLVV